MMILRSFHLLFLLIASCRSSQNSVTISLDAKWNNTPFVAEISEFLAAENPALFWRYLDHLHDLVADDKLAPTEDEESVYAAVLGAAKPLLSPLHLSLLELALASRAYSAAVEMNNQLAATVRAHTPSFPCSDSATVWASVNGHVVCSGQELAKHLQESKVPTADPNATADAVLLLKTDKVFGGGTVNEDSSVPVVVLYGDMRYKEMYEAHKVLKKASTTGKVQYVFRHRIVNVNTMKTRLSGYGVELAIKSTEYKAMDDTNITSGSSDDAKKQAAIEDRVAGFDFSILRSKHPSLEKELNEFRQHLSESVTEIVALKAWQLQDLSFQAAQRIASTAEKGDALLETFEDLSQNYPLRAHSLSQISVKHSFRTEIYNLQTSMEQILGLGAGSSALFVNGFLLNDIDPISLLELLRREARVMEGLHNLGVSGTQINKILRTKLADTSSISKFALDLREMPLSWLNDLEDGSSRYYGWPTSVRSLLEQAFPGMLRRVAKNLFHLVLVIDPEDPDSWPVMRYAQAFVAHSAPVRVGFLWSVRNASTEASEKKEDSVGEAMARTFNFVSVAEDDGLSGLDFLIQVISEAEQDKTTGGRVTVDLLRSHIVKRYSTTSADRVLGPGNEFRTNLDESRKYLAACGLSTKLPQVLMNGVPLDRRQVKDMFEETVVGYILEQTPVIQRAVYDGKLTDHMSTMDYLMSRPDVVTRLNQRILDPENNSFLNLGRRSQPTKAPVSSLQADELTAHVADSLIYLNKKEETTVVRPVSMWLAVDLNTAVGRLAVFDALKVLRSSGKMRVGLIHVGSAEGPDKVAGIDLVHTVQTALQVLPLQTARLFIAKLVKEANIEALQKGERTLQDLAVSDMNFDDFKKKMDAQSQDYKELHKVFGRKILQLTKDAPLAVIANGKIFGPLTDAEMFDTEDMRLLERVTLDSGGASALSSRLESMTWPGQVDLSDLSMRVSGIIQAASSTPETSMASITSKQRYAPLELPSMTSATEAVLRLYGDTSSPAFEFVAIVDPLTRDAQKIASVLRVLREAVNCNLYIVFNCKSKLSESPLKNFYRLVWSSRPSLKTWGRGLFLNMPAKPLLTMGVDAPHAWMVAAVHSSFDLDNIRLSNSPRVTAHFELEHLLLEGHCVDTVTGQPPRGLQFTLGGRRGQADVDTIVMANLGYFQMKANPGAWFLELRPGRSKDIYDISGHAYTDNMPDSPEVIAVIDSLRSKIIRVRVSKKMDKMDANLLGDDDESGSGVGSGIWSSISSGMNAFGGSKTKKSGENEVLNIFSVASGHLYERFLRIMMLSVLKHTKQPVKFWFLKNYLSPTFKDFIPHMAKEYKFEYELVQYKWPRWLHQQTEKQRIIWGYKILFLDVLFPLDVRKIIFVDADQTVRADLQELADLDLEGAPYGYTPFCDSRKEMDGFRFWKSGYWAQHLGHRRYHISALYVVDLVRFRRLAAGDRLRGQYQGLSQDPNSLSNLDQDLPNNMIHQVPIKSLPQEWLWCETWCSTEELARAKTIDLCNNPLTKEPKLQAAMRILSEWKDYDQEVKRVWDKVYGTKTAESSATSQTKPVEDKAPSKKEKVEL